MIPADGGLSAEAPRARGASRHARAAASVIGAGFVLVVLLVVASAVGALPISFDDVLAAIAAGVRGRAGELAGMPAIVWNLRLPRVLMAALVGASLGYSGAAMQGLFRNPLAEPYLLGVASGASLGATIALAIHQPALVPPLAFAGALLAVLVTIALARPAAVGRSASLLLAGVIVGSVLTSATSFLMLRDEARMRAVVSWTLGSLSSASWPDLGRVLPYAVAGFAVLFAAARRLDALQLGEDTARTLGVDVGATTLVVVAGASLATAAAVSSAGVIGFVGLVAPHVMRRLGTPAHRTLLAASGLAGGAMLVLADLGARTFVRPGELPVGIVTSLVGGPFFLWLLRKGAR